MSGWRCRAVLLLLLVSFAVAARAGGYTVYNHHRSNGFPGNKVYCIYQDTRNYIWTGTENGLVSFNGYDFKSYSTRDGLPDNEVLGINEDPAGRLWLLTFSNELCYLWNGKVHNRKNDPVLHHLTMAGMPNNIQFDESGAIWITESGTGAVIRLDARGQITRMTGIGSRSFQPITPLQIGPDGKVYLFNVPNLYRYDKDHFELVAKLPPHPAYRYTHFGFLAAVMEEFKWTPLPDFLKQYASGRSRYWKAADLLRINAIRKLSPDQLCISTRNGACLQDVCTGRITARLLSGCNVSVCMKARDGSLWFGTLGNGLFHCTKSFINSVPVSSRDSAVLFIRAGPDGLRFIDGGRLFGCIPFKGAGRYRPVRTAIATGRGQESFSYAGRDQKGNWFACASSGYAYKLGNGRLPALRLNTSLAKCTLEEDSIHLLIGTIEGVFRLNKADWAIADTLLNQRVTSVAIMGGRIYAGTFGGLIRLGTPEKKTGAHQPDILLGEHITALCTDGDSLLWAADNRAGLTIVRNGRAVSSIDGGSFGCNGISAMAASPAYLYVGTDNGVYVICKESPFQVIRHLSSASGLYSNQINCLEIADGRVWVGTDRGLNYFEEREIAPSPLPPALFINSIWNEEISIQPNTGTLTLEKKTLQLNFDVVDHSSFVRPAYAYRLNTNAWATSKNDNLYFPTIPYGYFTVSVRAQSPSWPVPQVLTLSFYRAPPYYLRCWFLLTAGTLFLLFAGALSVFFFRRAQDKDRKQLQVQQQLLQLEQMALQGQMNPHFIFNCVTAIRQYYNKGDIQKANRFVDAFAALIRATFEMASQPFTSLGKELRYLNDYLAIEQERFNHCFSFSITRQISLPESVIPVPSMLLQPLIENAVRHGVRHLPDGSGKIAITIRQEEGMVHIVLRDNGIGRARSAQLRRTLPALVTSTSVNKKRIGILNKLFGPRIHMRTDDLLTEDGAAAGTQVVLSYPLDIYAIET